MTEKDSLIQFIAELDLEGSLDLVRVRMDNGDSPQAIIEESRKGMEEVGARFETGEYFIADLMFSAEIFEIIMSLLETTGGPDMTGLRLGKVLTATVKDDIHDIGKNLVISMLRAEGFEILDLGVDVPPEDICHEIIKQSPNIVALSCLLTNSLASLEKTVQAIRSANLSGVKIIVGGIPVTEELAATMGADAYGRDAREAVVRCKELLGGHKRDE